MDNGKQINTNNIRYLPNKATVLWLASQATIPIVKVNTPKYTGYATLEAYSELLKSVEGISTNYNFKFIRVTNRAYNSLFKNNKLLTLGDLL